MNCILSRHFKATFLKSVSFCLSIAIVCSPSVMSQPIPASGDSPKLTDAQIVTNFSAFMDRLTAEDRFSGTVLLAKDETILFEQGYGFANHAFSAPNSIDTKFCLASVTKMFTAVAIMQLLQAGRLSLDDTLIKLVPDYPNAQVASNITVRQLLTHTAGLGDVHGQSFQITNPKKYQTLESWLPLIVDEPLLFTPGSQYAYSNAGFIVLGIIVEHVSGKTYYNYIQENIFKPAGMTDTGFYTVFDDVPNLALGYTRHIETESGIGPRNVDVSLHPGTSAGGCYSTVGDMLRFSLALQGHRLLDNKHTELLFTGLGIGSESIDGIHIVGFSGGSEGVNTRIDIYPDLGYTAVILSNFFEGAKSSWPWLRATLVKRLLPEEVQIASVDLQRFVGLYQQQKRTGGAPLRKGGGKSAALSPEGTEARPIEVAVDQNGLHVDLGQFGARSFLPRSTTEFFEEDNPASLLTFTLDEQGQVVAMSLSGGKVLISSAVKLP